MFPAAVAPPTEPLVFSSMPSPVVAVPVIEMPAIPVDKTAAAFWTTTPWLSVPLPLAPTPMIEISPPTDCTAVVASLISTPELSDVPFPPVPLMEIVPAVPPASVDDTVVPFRSRTPACEPVPASSPPAPVNMMSPVPVV